MKRLLLLLFIALVFRLIISPWPLHVDLLSHAEWGEQIFRHGTKGFYEQSIWTYSWPTQPPLGSYMNGLERNIYHILLELFRNIGHTIVKYHLAPWYMRWWFAFTIWFDQAKYSVEVGYPIGYFMSIKLLPILADLGIATVLYKVAKKKSKKPLLWPAIYLFSPFSWYLSSLWGQNDQVSFLFLLLSFFYESQRRLPVLTPLLFAISVALKPTSLIFSPFFVFAYLKNHHKKVNWLFGSIFVLALFWYSTALFTDVNPFIYTKEVLIQKIFFKSEFRVSTNAFNFWHILIGNRAFGAGKPFLFIPAKFWGILAYIVLNILAFKHTKKITPSSVYSALFIVGAGSFIFVTNMLDRYLFAGLVFGLFATIFKPKLFKAWLVISLVFVLNLFNQWWYPYYLEPLSHFLRWQQGFMTRVLSLILVIAALKAFRRILKA